MRVFFIFISILLWASCAQAQYNNDWSFEAAQRRQAEEQVKKREQEAAAIAEAKAK